MIMWHKKNVVIHEFLIPKKLTLSCKSAYSKYKVVIESARAETVRKLHENKWKIVIVEIANVKCNTVSNTSCLKLVSTFFIKFLFFNQMIALQNLWKVFFISSKKLFWLLRYSNFCIFSPSFPDFPDSKGQIEVE